MGTANAKLIKNLSDCFRIYGGDHALTKAAIVEVEQSQARCAHPAPEKRTAQVPLKAIGIPAGDSFLLCLLCGKGLPLKKGKT